MRDTEILAERHLEAFVLCAVVGNPTRRPDLAETRNHSLEGRQERPRHVDGLAEWDHARPSNSRLRMAICSMSSYRPCLYAASRATPSRLKPALSYTRIAAWLLANTPRNTRCRFRSLNA